MTYASQASATPSSGTTVTIAKPAGTASGDVLVALIVASTSSTAPTITPPSGWVAVGTFANGPSKTAGVWTRAAGGSEPANYAWTSSVAMNQAAGVVLRYAPQSPTQSPGAVDATAMGSGVASPGVAPSVSATGDNDTLISLFTANVTAGSGVSGMTQRAAIAPVGSVTAYAYDELLTAAGATGTRTWTGSTQGFGFTVALLANQQGSRVRMMI